MNPNYGRRVVNIAQYQSQRSFYPLSLCLAALRNTLEGQHAEVRPACREAYISDLF
jgi:hypothetical protein